MAIGRLGTGFGRMGLACAVVSSGFTPANSETTAWLNAVVGDGGTVSLAREQLVDSLITSLKSAGVWTKKDREWLYAAENTQSALRDIKTAALASVVNAPTFTIDRGYTGNGTSSYVNSGFTPSTNGVTYVQDSAHVSAWSLTAGAGASSSNRLIGNITGTTPRSVLIPRSAGDVALHLMNDATGASPANTSTDGLFMVNRSAAGATQVYRNGVSIGTGTVASSGLPTTAITFDQDNASNFGTFQVAAGGAGGSLSGAEATSYYNALLTYMQAVGAA